MRDTIDDRPFSAVLIAAHGDGGEARRNLAIQALAERLAKQVDLPVAWALLKEPDSFAAARARLGAAAEGRVAVYPFFMSAGYFARVRLPKALAAAGFERVEILRPFGEDPRLVDLVERRLRAAAAMAGGREAAGCRILMVAHGSGSGHPESRRRAEAVAAELGYRGLGTIGLGFIEEAPFFDAAIDEQAPEIVLGFFASAGTHAIDDVAELVARSPSVLSHIEAIGADLAVADLVVGALEDCISVGNP